jgi:hypothetical protein
VIVEKGRNIDRVLKVRKSGFEGVSNYCSDKEDVAWTHKGVVGRVLKGEDVLVVQQRILDDGFENVYVIPMGGDNVFLTCIEKIHDNYL